MSNINVVLGGKGVGWNSSSPAYFISIPYAHPTDSENVCLYLSKNNNGIVGVRTGMNRTTYNTVYITVWYTCTNR